MLEYMAENKDKIKHEPQETKEVEKFLKKGDVKTMMDKYNKELKAFFDFYCKCEDHKIGYDYEERVQRLNYKCLTRFGYQTNIVPTLISVEDLNYLFHRLL